MFAIFNSLGHYSLVLTIPVKFVRGDPASATFSLPASPHSTGRRIQCQACLDRQARAQRDELRDHSDLGVSPRIAVSGNGGSVKFNSTHERDQRARHEISALAERLARSLPAI
jgi:hypothetical protein